MEDVVNKKLHINCYEISSSSKMAVYNLNNFLVNYLLTLSAVFTDFVMVVKLKLCI